MDCRKPYHPCSKLERNCTFITAATAAFGTYRVAVYAGSRAMGVANATLIKGTLAAKQKTAADLVMASNYRTLTAAEKD